MWRAGHIGVYIGDGLIIEARGFNTGIVKTRIQDRDFTHWGMDNRLTFDETPTTQPVPLGERTLRQGMSGADVEQLQGMLNELGYPAGTQDGAYGPATTGAVRALQKATGLTPDGIYGPKSHAALMELINTDPVKQPDPAPPSAGMVRVIGSTVNIRSGPGTQYPSLTIVRKGALLPPVSVDGWTPILYNGQVAFISQKYSKITKP